MIPRNQEGPDSYQIRKLIRIWRLSNMHVGSERTTIKLTGKLSLVNHVLLIFLQLAPLVKYK